MEGEAQPGVQRSEGCHREAAGTERAPNFALPRGQASHGSVRVDAMQEQCGIAAKEVLQSLDEYLHEKFSVVPQQLIPPRHQQ